MRKLIFLFLIAVVLYSGYWLIGARTTERSIAAWLSARQAEGWQADYAALDTGGYPLSFHTVLQDLAIADPKTGVAYQTSQFELKSRSFTPTRVEATLAQDLRVSTPLQTINATNETINSTLVLGVGPSLTVHQAAFNFSEITAQSSAGWELFLNEAQAQAVRNPDTPFTYETQFSLTGLKPSSGLLSKLNPEGVLSDTFDSLQIDTTIKFDKDWDITALEGPRPQPKHVVLHKASAIWGAVNLNIAGEFDVDKQGYPNGTIQIQATNWRELIALGTASGVIPQSMESIALRAGEILAKMKGNANTIDAELSLSGGSIAFGFIPLGPAPRLIIR
ncbi:hypothetical protein EDD53_1556 [Pacificibacter maritimus]|uniref:DUF2125 domain-containing protein n=1 Tax=Pacificibacter maritimus TaxID=762213 RepID=A0A3N4U9K7_9RHOB|nr:DUF2125 domain-containing protein [Pacificibacter maritimus]RPE67152.1 hypothetical protein EDD53_1556 [Pacificibacter maritimus]